MDKKGLFGISETFAIFWLVIAFVGFWLAFEIADSFGSGDGELVSYEIEESKEYGLVFLKTPLEIDGIKMTFADLIVESVESKDYELLEESLDEQFDESEIYWLVLVHDSEGNLVKKLTRSGWSSKGGQRENIQEIRVPGYNEDELRISLRLTGGERLV